MRLVKFLVLIVIAGLCLPVPFSAAECSLETQLSASRRKDRIRWNFSGRRGRPNILSELTFADIHVNALCLSMKARHGHFFCHVTGLWGNITSGTAEDSDYLKNNRKMEFSRSTMKVRGSYIAEGHINIGHDFSFLPLCSWAPVAGYMYMQERLRLQDGIQVRDINPHTLQTIKTHTHIKHVNSTYKARWDSPCIGMNLKLSLSSRFSLSGQYLHYFLLKYNGTTFWNLRQDDFHGSGHQSSNRHRGHGYMFAVDAIYSLSKDADLAFGIGRTRLIARGGYDKKKLRDGTTSCVPLRKATMHCKEIRFGLTFRF